MKRVLSGIQPSGTPTLGNYLGAMKRWAEGQNGQENIFPVVNLHAISVRQDPQELLGNSLNAVAWLLAAGIEADKSILFLQSQVPEHSELGWILNNYTTFGELERMTQFKDKSRKLGPEGQLVGLFDYPVLMAADILLYDSDEVPVGEDQKQHVELTRDIATRFNNLYGPTFKVPQPALPTVGARIMNLQRPSDKMSKSDEGDPGVVYLDDSPDDITAKVMRAVTDSGNQVRPGDDKPAVTNLIQVYSALADKTVADVEASYAGKGYGEFKKDLAELMVSVLQPLQGRFSQLRSNDDALGRCLEVGRIKATEIAGPKLEEVKAKIGLL